MGNRSLVTQDRLVGNHFASGQKELRHRNRQMIVAADVRRLISNAEDRMMNEEKAATDFVRFVSFLHSSFFILPSE
jgi:hypothetical protein